MLTLDMDDVVQRGITVVREGESMWPPPAVQVSATPKVVDTHPAGMKEEKAKLTARGRMTIVGISALVLFGLISISPPPLQERLTVFALAIVIGYYVIGNVHHALHTPLMSVTNAISGIIVVGALLQLGEESTPIMLIAFVATLLASINVFGGFAVTRRMLGLFTRS